MKGAILLAKDPGFFAEYRRYLMQFKHEPDGANNEPDGPNNSCKVTRHDGMYFMFYDNLDGEPYKENEFPSEARSQGYIYAFLVECRSEELFCEIVGASPPSLDFLVCDSDERLCRPNQLSPDTLSL